MYCNGCGKELYDNGDDWFICPYCGAEVVPGSVVSGEMPQEDSKRPVQGREDWRNRANRREYWLKFVLVLAVVVAATLSVKPLSYVLPATVLFVCWFVLFLGCVLYWLCDAVRRRLHDFGRSGWWVVLYFVIKIIVGNLERNGVVSEQFSDVFQTVETIIVIAVGLWPGTPARNEYGSVPPKKSFLWWPWGGDKSETKQ